MRDDVFTAILFLKRGVMQGHHYIFKDTKDQAEYERLKKIESLFDPRTISFLKSIGLRSGMSILEAGPGAGGILGALLDLVGDSGKVTAMDMDIRFLKDWAHPFLYIKEADLTQADLGKEEFDFIHARYVMMHIAKFRDVLKKMRDALKPGGWLVLEDADFTAARIDESTPPERTRVFSGVSKAIEKLFSDKGIHHAFGKNLSVCLSEAGFSHIKEEVYAPWDRGGEGTAEIMRLSAFQLWKQYVEKGFVNESDLEIYVKLAGDPRQAAVYYATVSAWGQKF